MSIVRRSLFALLILAAAARPAGAVIYRGFPHLHLLVAVVDAGGGASNFNSRRFVARLAGPEAAAENAKLVRQYGTARVGSFYDVFGFAVKDGVKRAHNLLIPLPRSGQPDPRDGAALASALYHAGMDPAGRYDVGYMLEMLMSHQIHHSIMGDMDKTFTPPVNGEFHVILTTVIRDLGSQ